MLQGVGQEASAAFANAVLNSFRNFDLNHDGVIDREELGIVLRQLSAEAWTDEKVDALFDAMDTNNDGKIHYEEFIEQVMRSHAPAGIAHRTPVPKPVPKGKVPGKAMAAPASQSEVQSNAVSDFKGALADLPGEDLAELASTHFQALNMPAMTHYGHYIGPAGMPAGMPGAQGALFSSLITTMSITCDEISGRRIATLSVAPEWTGETLKDMLQKELPLGEFCAQIVNGTDMLLDEATLGEAGITEGASLQVVLSSYPEEIVREWLADYRAANESYQLVCETVRNMIEANKKLIEFNVGGTIFQTTFATATKHPNSLLCKMVEKADPEEGAIFIDRNPVVFSIILDYLRYGKLPPAAIPVASEAAGGDLTPLVAREAQYFGLSEMFNQDPTLPGAKPAMAKPAMAKPKSMPRGQTPAEPEEPLRASKELVEELALERQKWKTVLNSSSSHSAMNNRVKLNVGGVYFETTVGSLTRDRYSFFGELFSGKYDVPGLTDGAFLIDTSPKGFEGILDYLRTGDAMIFATNPMLEKLASADAVHFNLKHLPSSGSTGLCIQHEGPYGIEPGLPPSEARQLPNRRTPAGRSRK
eukprot:TRINITY_DN15595_c0_g2_i3.p1 TRINITY_DN15595_c0_g2~~TRINITY_DN15595_c0_g2_i3.p1  ORF type:complete len:588 (-),score=84.75 TRINITY_DN15595_c0_g2_i3:80-1843(-)